MRIVSALTIVLLGFAAGCGDQTGSTDPEMAARVEAGEALFQENCSHCHPRGGRGDYLKRIPATVLTRRSADELSAWIAGSDKHREMPNFPNLSAEQREALSSYLLDQLP